MGKNIETESGKSRTTTKTKYDEVLTKVIIRRLPPNLNKHLLLQTLTGLFPDGLPDHDYFRFCGSDLSFSPVSFSRAYINFKHPKDILTFKEKLDGYVFTDSKGGKYPVVVEFAPFQGVPKKNRRRKDIKASTIEKDADYLSFLETLKQEVEPLPSAEVYLEQQEANKQSMKDAKLTTPLIEFLKMKKTSGKSRISSQRSSTASSNSNEKKRKTPKEGGKTGFKNTFPEKNIGSHNSGDSSKKGSDRKTDTRKPTKDDSERKQGTSHGRKNEKSREYKEKRQGEEKEKSAAKDKPSPSAKTYKEGRSQNENQRSSSNVSRSSSSYRQPRRDKGMKDPDKARFESRPSTATGPPSGDKNEERRPQKHQQDNKERVRNKDRPAQAIYQPRSRPRANEEAAARNSGRQKEQGRSYRDNPGGDRGRDNRDLNRRQGRDTQKMQEKSEDTSKE